MWVQLNDRIVPEEEARVSVFDRGFTYGDGVFETIRAYEGKPLCLAEHLARLSGAASRECARSECSIRTHSMFPDRSPTLSRSITRRTCLPARVACTDTPTHRHSVGPRQPPGLRPVLPTFFPHFYPGSHVFSEIRSAGGPNLGFPGGSIAAFRKNAPVIRVLKAPEVAGVVADHRFSDCRVRFRLF